MTEQEAVVKSNSLSIILPISHETKDLKELHKSILRSLSIADIKEYEIIIVSQTTYDGNNNKDTLTNIEDLLATDPNVFHVFNPVFVGLGIQYRQGIHKATKDYVMVIPPYRLVEESSLAGLMLYLGQADVIFTYPSNTDTQSSEVRYISKSYSALCNLLFALNIKSYTGISIIKRDLLVKVPMRSNDLTCLAETAVYLIKSGTRYLELPYTIKSSADMERYRNTTDTLGIFGSLVSLFWRINIKDEGLNSGQKITSQSNFTLPIPNGSPDLNAIYQFASGNAVQILHQIVVYLGKAIDRHFSPPQVSGNGHLADWSPGVQDAFNVFKVIKVLNSIMTKIIAMVSIVDTASNRVTKRRRKGKKKKDQISLTVIMPAYNEATKLLSAYQRASWAIDKAGIPDYEILVITNLCPDSSHDGTPDIATSIAQSDNRVRHIHNDAYVGLGFKYRQGVSEAKKCYTMMIPGDGEFNESSVAEVMSHIGKADIIIPYISNQEVRPPERQTTSRTFTLLCNKMFGLSIRYYNGVCIIPTDYLRAVPMSCDNFAYMAEILVYLIKSGANYLEVPWQIKRVEGSKAFRPESVNEVLETMSTLFWKINIEGARINLTTSNRVV